METYILRELKKIKSDISNGVITTSGELTNRVLSAFSVAETGLYLPKFVSSEPPSSTKVNFLTSRLEKALYNREYIFDLLNAASTYEYSEAMKILDSLEDKVLGLGDSVQTLYFYSKPYRSNMHVVGADFTTSWCFFRNDVNSLQLNIAGGLTLPVVRSNISAAETTEDGDGMSGAWFIVDNDDELTADIEKRNQTYNLFDSDPLTYYEYGRFRLSEEQLSSTEGWGFGFSDTDYKWASTEYNDVSLDLTFKLEEITNTNYIVIQPSVSSDSFVVKRVSLVLGGVTQKTLEPEDLVVNQNLMMRYEGGYANSAAYIFEPTLADEIVVSLYSNYPVETKVRHMYTEDDDGERIAGSSPPMGYPHIYLHSGPVSSNIEDMTLDRFYIGIKDMSIQSNTYGTEGYATTPDPIKFGKPIDRVALTSDFIEPDGTTVKFEISFDGDKWYTISPLGKSLSNQIIAVNDRVPGAYRDPSTTYISIDGSPSELYARISATRKSGGEYISPVIQNVQYEVTLKDEY